MRCPAIYLAFLCSLLIACQKEKPVHVNQEFYPIPGENFFPEGIAYDAAEGVFYTGSSTTGNIVRVNVKTGATELFGASAKQDRTSALGMKLDYRNRLWVCGGETGRVHVLNKSGE